ncbi:MAG: glycosyltransferase [Candidatus Competibacteraceae bacterium]|nr:glycosyltransferase [Candidatus Competibacteraceae bacterium]
MATDSKINSGPLISVIVPVYGTEKYLRRCLDSLLNQTYQNLEIIIINDCSPDGSATIIDEYAHSDNRVVQFNNSHNMGLFHSRLVGADLSTGDYITFLDSDDYLAIDTYRLLQRALENENADIACCNIVMEHEPENRKYIHQLNNKKAEKISGDRILAEYFDQEGLSFYWHTVWNKMYSISSWKKARPHYEGVKKHLIMAEDFAFCTVLYFYSEHFVSVEYDGVFYSQNENASTGLYGSIEKYIKNITDLGTAFNFIESFLREVNIYETHKVKFFNWKSRYSRFWVDNINNSNLKKPERAKARKKLKEAFRSDQLYPSKTSDHFIYSLSIDWNPNYELLKSKIASGAYDYISFDIFDTLVVRPFLEPSDLFVLLNNRFRQLCKSKAFVDFSSIRIEAEKTVRTLANIKYPQFEEITLDEIYAHLIEQYNIDMAVAEEIKQLEQLLEIQYSEPRQSAIEIYDMALDIGCKIVLVSDMYLPHDNIVSILNKVGIKGTKEFIFLRQPDCRNIMEECMIISSAKRLAVRKESFI